MAITCTFIDGYLTSVTGLTSNSFTLTGSMLEDCGGSFYGIASFCSFDKPITSLTIEDISAAAPFQDCCMIKAQAFSNCYALTTVSLNSLCRFDTAYALANVASITHQSGYGFWFYGTKVSGFTIVQNSLPELRHIYGAFSNDSIYTAIASDSTCKNIICFAPRSNFASSPLLNGHVLGPSACAGMAMNLNIIKFSIQNAVEFGDCCFYGTNFSDITIGNGSGDGISTGSSGITSIKFGNWCFAYATNIGTISMSQIAKLGKSMFYGANISCSSATINLLSTYDRSNNAVPETLTGYTKRQGYFYASNLTSSFQCSVNSPEKLNPIATSYWSDTDYWAYISESQKIQHNE